MIEFEYTNTTASHVHIEHAAVSNINDAYDLALKHGARGGKLLGAGGGGFLLFYCEKEKQAGLTDAMNKFRRIPFGLEHEGSKVIYFGEEKVY